MKKILLLLLSLTLTTGVVFGATYYSKSDIGQFNLADIYMNGKKVLAKGEDFVDVKGNVLPSSISFNDTTYVPLRKLSEILSLNVIWDGSIKLSDASEKVTEIQYNKENINYTNKINLGKAPVGYKTIFVEDANGTLLKDIMVEIKSGDLIVTNGYRLQRNKSYFVNTIVGMEILKREVTISDITLNSFTDNGWAWEVVVPADAKKGFHHPFIIRIPKLTGNISEDLKSMKSTLLAEGSNEFLTMNNDEVVSKVLSTYNGWYSSVLGDAGHYISMMSLFPRPTEDGLLYTHSLDRDTLFGTESYLNSLGRGNLYRIDKQYDAMISETIKILSGLGKSVDQKVFLIGFSASSDFATRFNYTHPDRAKAIVVNSAPTLPLTEYKGMTLNFPLGMADIAKVTGKPFDVKKFKAVPQFWHTGDKDLNDGSYYSDGWGNYGNPSLDYNQEGIDYRKAFGNDIVARKALIEKILTDSGFSNIKHKTYKGVEHGWNDEIVTDALTFLEKNQ